MKKNQILIVVLVAVAVVLGMFFIRVSPTKDTTDNATSVGNNPPANQSENQPATPTNPEPIQPL